MEKRIGREIEEKEEHLQDIEPRIDLKLVQLYEFDSGTDITVIASFDCI